MTFDWSTCEIEVRSGAATAGTTPEIAIESASALAHMPFIISFILVTSRNPVPVG
jgi:hypothetical protein